MKTPPQSAPRPRPRPRSSAPRAFTLVEVMVSSFVMVFGIAAAIIVLQSGFKAMDTARSTTLAAQIMQSEMERIRLLPWDTSTVLLDSAGQPVLDAAGQPVRKPAIVRLLPEETIDPATLFPVGTTTAAIGARFTIVRATADVPGRAGEMKTITITITWTGLDGVSRTRSSSTQYSKNGLYDYYYTKAKV